MESARTVCNCAKFDLKEEGRFEDDRSINTVQTKYTKVLYETLNLWAQIIHLRDEGEREGEEEPPPKRLGLFKTIKNKNKPET